MRLDGFRAGTIYVETAITAGMEWDVGELERLIDGREYGDRTNRYRKMYEGTLSLNKTCRRIQKKLGGGHLCEWKNHAYWGLLCSAKSGPEYTERALKTVKGGVQQYIWTHQREKGFEYYSARIDTTMDVVKAVAKYHNFDALLTLTAWAREAREHNILRPNYQSASYSRKVFARAVCNTPQLFIRWPLLAYYYKHLIWSFPVTKVSEPWFLMEWDELPGEMEIEEKNARQRGIKLPPKEIFDLVNKNTDLLLRHKNLL